MSLAFDEATHSYTWNGVRVPSVTQVLRPLYFDLRFVAADLLEHKSGLGKAVHKAVELHVKKGLDYESLDPIVARYFDQFLLFEVESGFRFDQAEVFVHHPLGYAGQVDLCGIRGQGFLASRVTVDVKTTSTLSRAVALQTAAYQGALVDKPARYALRLTPDRYYLVPYKNDAQDFADFLGFLRVHQWCAANNKTMEL